MSNYYKVISGIHAEGGNVYKKGDVFESAYNLERLNFPPTSIKFEKVSEEDPRVLKLKNKSQKPAEPEQEVEEPSVATAVATDPGYSKEELQELKSKDLESIAEELGLDISEVSKSARYRKQELITLILGEE